MSADLVALEAKFRETAQAVRDSPPKEQSTETKLTIYSLYKQATLGDVQGEQPWAVQFESRSKWDAWNALKGMDKATAMKKYIEEAQKLL